MHMSGQSMIMTCQLRDAQQNSQSLRNSNLRSFLHKVSNNTTQKQWHEQSLSKSSTCVPLSILSTLRRGHNTWYMVEVLCCSSLLKCVKSLIFTVALGSTNFMALLGKKHAQKQAEEIGAGLPSKTQKMGYTGLHRIHGNGMACFIIL